MIEPGLVIILSNKTLHFLASQVNIVKEMDVNRKKRFYCNTELALSVVGGKWKPLIIYHLGKNDTLRFGEFRKVIPSINQRVLTRELKDLVEHKIINRRDFYKNPPHVEYTLTESGKSLISLIEQLGDWGKRYNEIFKYGEVVYINKYSDDKC